MARRPVDSTSGKAATSILAVRLSSRQRDLIERAAQRDGLVTLSAYVRDAALVAAAEDLGIDPGEVVGTERGD